MYDDDDDGGKVPAKLPSLVLKFRSRKIFATTRRRRNFSGLKKQEKTLNFSFWESLNFQ